MFDGNIGKLIQTAATIFLVIGIFAAFIGGIVMFLNAESAGEVVLSVVILVGGGFFSWAFSILVYGFGQLIDDTATIRQQIQIAANSEKDDLNSLTDERLIERAKSLRAEYQSGRMSAKQYNAEIGAIKAIYDARQQVNQ